MGNVRTTIYFDPNVLQALKLRGIKTKSSVSDLANYAVRMQVLEDYEDIKSFEEREDEPTMPFLSFVENLKNDEKI